MSDQKYKCPDCEMRYQTRDFLKAHIRSAHRESYAPKFDWINTLTPPQRPMVDVLWEKIDGWRAAFPRISD